MSASKSVVITGASTGIGEAAARVLATNGIHVFGSVRKKADGERLRKDLGDQFTPLIFDVTKPDEIAKSVPVVEEHLAGRTLDGLVNNAGIALGGPLIHQPAEQFSKVLEVNLMGVVHTTQAFAPLLGADKSRTGAPGRIVNIGSVGGRNAFPFMSAYHTTKFGLEGLTESLRRELLIFGIDAILVAPGSVVTPIWDKADEVDYSRYDDTAYAESTKRLVKATTDMGRKGLPAEVIGQTIYEALTSPKPKVYYRVTQHPMRFRFLNWLPKRYVDRTMAKHLDLLPK